MTTIGITYDESLIDDIAARFDLRDPNRAALQAVVRGMTEKAPSTEGYPELIADLATGVGKTFLMSALVDYAAEQGIRNILVVTPGSVIQEKTVANFDDASEKYVAGADHVPLVITPENAFTGTVAGSLSDPGQLKVFVFNVQQLLRPADNTSRRMREIDENLGLDLYSHLKSADDLLVIADEHHIYHRSARAFSAAIRGLDPVALIGLTATPDPDDADHIVFQYTLGQAIADGYVKTPVIVYRKDGIKDERTQLADACHLLRRKDAAYRQVVASSPDLRPVKPVLFVVCSSIPHATEVGQLLAQEGFIGDPGAVLEITSQSSDEALTALARCEEADSQIRAIVSVNMLREGWDVKNIAVIVALRRLASQALTEQILGRGLRLPFGVLTGVPMVDQVDLVAHDSYQQLLDQKDVLVQRIEASPVTVEVDANGSAVGCEPARGDEGTAVPEASGDDGDTPANEPFRPAGRPGTPAAAPQPAPFVLLPDAGGDPTPSLFVVGVDERGEEPTPRPINRVEGAPAILFPRREARITAAPFSLSEIADGDAQAAGARFLTEVPSFLAKDALVARREGDDVEITVTPQESVAVQQALTSIEIIRSDLTAAIFRSAQETVAEKRAARRLADAFLRGAGVGGGDDQAEWGENRRQQAIAGMVKLIRDRYARRDRAMTYELVPVRVPIEPVLSVPTENAYNAPFVKHAHYAGWQRNIMPFASFDAGSTEWKIAHLLDRDEEIAWWLRIYTNGPAFISTTDGNYFPDFVAIDRAGAFWLIEGKSNKNAGDADVLRKKAAAEDWARHVRDDGAYGEWHYVFATESDIKSAGSWTALKVATDPE